MKTRVTELREIGDGLFAKRMPLVSRWQDLAENFYPERADFTNPRLVSQDFAAHLMTGQPALARRDLANALSAMLRPRGQQWFDMRVASDTLNEDQAAKRWMEWASKMMRNFMYDTGAHFKRATTTGDHDFATFGQCVISVDINEFQNGLLYRPWHLRDCVWCENPSLDIDTIHRQQKMTVRDMIKQWGADKVHRQINELAEKEPYKEFSVRHIMVPAGEYDLVDKKKKWPFVSIWIDVENQHIMEEVGQPRINYVIPRWQTVAGSQYAHSPATVIAIPDARLLQQMTLTLLEAGQKAVDPPLIAVGEVIQGGVNTFAGGVTWVDAEYDERLGEVLRAMSVDKSGLQFGIDREERVQQFIDKAFFIDRLQLPAIDGEKMTATETRIRMEEYMRRALPLFEPMEVEYNGALCNMTLEILLEQGGIPMDNMPRILGGQEIRFQFQSPIQEATKRINMQAFMESAQLLQFAAAMDQNAMAVFDVEKALRDGIEGTGAPATWIRTDEEIAAIQQAKAQQAQLEKVAEMAQGAGVVAEQAGKAGKSLIEGGLASPADMQGMLN